MNTLQLARNGNSKTWLIVLVVLLLVVGCCIASCVATMYFGASVATEPMDAFAEYANNHPVISEKLGTPVERVGLMDGGTLEFESDTPGTVEIGMTLSGPKGKAEVSGTMAGQPGQAWTPVNLTVTFEDGTSIVVPGSGQGGGADFGE